MPNPIPIPHCNPFAGAAAFCKGSPRSTNITFRYALIPHSFSNLHSSCVLSRPSKSTSHSFIYFYIYEFADYWERTAAVYIPPMSTSRDFFFSNADEENISNADEENIFASCFVYLWCKGTKKSKRLSGGYLVVTNSPPRQAAQDHL